MLLVQREQPPLSVGREATSMSDQSRRIVVGDVPAVHQGPDGRTDDAGRLWPAFSGLCSQPGTGTASSWSAGLWCGPSLRHAPARSAGHLRAAVVASFGQRQIRARDPAQHGPVVSPDRMGSSILLRRRRIVLMVVNVGPHFCPSGECAPTLDCCGSKRSACSFQGQQPDFCRLSANGIVTCW